MSRLSRHKNLHLPEVGDEIKCVWVDSAVGAVNYPARDKCLLHIATTYGKVSYRGKDTRIHQRMCSKKKCRCLYLELAMCSSGEKDNRSDLVSIWLEAMISIEVLGHEDPDD